MLKNEIALIADGQLGIRLYGLQETYQDWKNAFRAATQKIIERKTIRSVYFLGDTFDAESLYPGEVFTAQHCVKQLIAAGIAVYGILGNHDKGQRDHNHTISWFDVCSITALEAETAIKEEYSTWIIGIHHKGKKLLANVLDKLSIPPEANKGDQILLFLHQSLKELSPYGQGWEVEAAQIPDWVSHVFLGDFHNRCHVIDSRGIPFEYVGAIETSSFNQTTTPGFLIYNLQTQRTEHVSTQQRCYIKLPLASLPKVGWEEGLKSQLERATRDFFGKKPVVQLQGEHTYSADIESFCNQYALKVVLQMAYAEEPNHEVPSNETDVLKLADERLPKTELGDLARRLLKDPNKNALRDWQQSKYPNAAIKKQ